MIAYALPRLVYGSLAGASYSTSILAGVVCADADPPIVTQMDPTPRVQVAL